jgi:hypothetical protein
LSLIGGSPRPVNSGVRQLSLRRKNFMSKLLDDKDFLGIPYGIEDLEIIGDTMFAVGVPSYSPPEFKKYVFAAAKAYYAGNRIDYILKNYGDKWDFSSKLDKDSKLVLAIISVIKEQISSALRFVRSIDNKPDKPPLFAAGAALFRLQSTFRAVMITIRQGLHFESAAMERLILEQLAWIYSIHNLDDSKDDFFKIQPSKCVTGFKQVFPYVGKFYGLLSESGHITPNMTFRYIVVEDGGLTVYVTSSKYAKYDAFNLLLLCDMYIVLSELIYADLLKKFRHLSRNSKGELRPKPNRPMVKILKRYQSLITGRREGKK